MSRYLPPFLYSDATFKAIQSALNFEHEHYWLKLIEVSRNLFLDTCDEAALADWERLLKITPFTSDVETRRKLAKLKRRNGQAMTVSHTVEVLESFLRFKTESTSVGVDEIGNNQIRLLLKNGDFHWNELTDSLFLLLPAHVGIFDFGIEIEPETHAVYLAQVLASSNPSTYNLSLDETPPLIVSPAVVPVNISETIFGTDPPHAEFLTDIRAGFHVSESESLTIDCDRAELDDEETALQFERYIRQRWANFKSNPVVKFYYHYFLEIEEIDPGDEEIFPLEQDFLRLYFSMAGTDSIRFLTLLNPRPNLTANEINALSLNSKKMLLSRKGFFSDKIIRAVYVNKETLKVL